MAEPAELLEREKKTHWQITLKTNLTHVGFHLYLSGLEAASDCGCSGLSSEGRTVVGEEFDTAAAAAVELEAEAAGDGGGAAELGFTFNRI